MIWVRPEASITYYYRGITYRIQKKYAAALADLNRGLELLDSKERHRYFDFYWQRARVYGECQKYDLEVADLEKALTLAASPFRVQDCKNRIQEIRVLLSVGSAAAAIMVAAQKLGPTWSTDFDPRSKHLSLLSGEYSRYSRTTTTTTTTAVIVRLSNSVCQLLPSNFVDLHF